MPTINLFTLDLVTKYEEYPKVKVPHNLSDRTPALSAPGPGTSGLGTSGLGVMPLAQAKHTAPNVLIPTYLPNGFSFAWGHAHSADKILLVYQKDLGDEFVEKLHIIEQSVSGHMSVPAANYHELSVDAHKGFYIDGGWVVNTAEAKPEGGFVTAEWEVGHSASLVFERDNFWIMLYIRHPGRLAANIEEELALVGKSLSRQ